MSSTCRDSFSRATASKKQRSMSAETQNNHVDQLAVVETTVDEQQALETSPTRASEDAHSAAGSERRGEEDDVVALLQTLAALPSPKKTNASSTRATVTASNSTAGNAYSGNAADAARDNVSVRSTANELDAAVAIKRRGRKRQAVVGEPSELGESTLDIDESAALIATMAASTTEEHNPVVVVVVAATSGGATKKRRARKRAETAPAADAVVVEGSALQQQVTSTASASADTAGVDAEVTRGGADDESEHGDWVIRCLCGNNVDDGSTMIQCEKCDVWQHAVCTGFRGAESVPEKFLCERCEARPVSCICDSTELSGRIVRCAECARWQHQACVGLERPGKRPRVPTKYYCGCVV
jgi:hypothetical protein